MHQSELTIGLRSKLGILRVATIGIATLLCASSQAASRQALERTARTACLSGDYEKGVAILSELFVDTKDPNHIFNQARCFEQNRRYDEAIGRFQEYLRVGTDLTDADRAMAEKHIADCQELLAKQGARTVAAAPTPARSEPPPPAPASSPPAEASVPAVPDANLTQPVVSSSASGLRLAGIGVASVGLVGLATGLVLNLKANKMADDMKAFGAYSDSKESSRKNYEIGGWVGYGAGAACLVTGAVLYYFGAQSGGRASSSVALLPLLGSNAAGASVGGAF